MMDEQEDTVTPALYDLHDAIERVQESIREMSEEVQALRELLEAMDA